MASSSLSLHPLPVRARRARTPSAEDSRPTVVPAFDLEAFARGSELQQRSAVHGGADETTMDRARRLHAEGEHEKALGLLTSLVTVSPLHSEAGALAGSCRQAIEQDCLAALGSRSTILVVAVSPSELKRFSLDGVCGFLLSVMDGITDVEALLDISGLPRVLALRQLRSLLERGIVTVRSQGV